MPQKQIVTGLVTAAVYVGLEYVVHHHLMGQMYRDTLSTWRMQSEMKSLLPFLIAGQAMFGFFFGLIYTKGFESGKEPLGQGLRFGSLMAMMLAPSSALVWYTVLPIPRELALSWGVYGLVEMVILGVIAGRVYKP